MQKYGLFVVFKPMDPHKSADGIVNFLKSGSLRIVVFLKMVSIVLIGTGNVARHLYDAFGNTDFFKVIQVAGRNRKALDYFKPRTATSTNFRDLADADIYIIALSDDAISTVSEKLIIKNKLLVHTSGSVHIEALPETNRTGVLYPLQSFTSDLPVTFKEVPICIEAGNGADLEILNKMASALSDRVYEISSEQRKSLHLAAVFVNNFTNHLYAIGEDICLENNLPFSILHPLVRETSKKIENVSPKDAQTGPARRNDTGTMEKHLDGLDNATRAEIYSLMSRSIRESYDSGNV